MKHFYQDIEDDGWFTFPTIYSTMVQKFDSGSHFVEVGSWKGTSASYMAVEIFNSHKEIKFDCIDFWEYTDTQNDSKKEAFENLFNIFIKNTKPVEFMINPIKSISWEAASLYKDESIDFIFIDASHIYEYVLKDLEAFYPKIKPGGVMAGHDYTWCEDVQKAVNDFFENDKILTLENCWIYYK